ncbi:MAG: hypothetical protein WCX65_12170 [bacterium]
MAANYIRDDLTAQKASVARVDLKSSHWADNVRKAYLGLTVDSAFKARLQELVRQNFESGALRQVSAEEVSSLVSDGGSARPESLREQDAMKNLVSLGKLNEATFLNVFHITGDSFMVKSALNVLRRGNVDEDVEPVQETDGQMG